MLISLVGAPYLAIHLKKILEQDHILYNGSGNIDFIDSQNSIQKKQRFFEILNSSYNNA